MHNQLDKKPCCLQKQVVVLRQQEGQKVCFQFVLYQLPFRVHLLTLATRLW